jgi:hypothetical protein
MPYHRPFPYLGYQRVEKNAHAHLVIKKAWRKVKGTRKKREKVLPETNRCVAGADGHGFDSRRRCRLPKLNGGRTSSAGKIP